MAFQVTKNTIIQEVLEADRNAAIVLMQAGMHCVGCPSSIGESLEEACMVHGIDCDVLVKDLNDYFLQK